MSDRFTTLQQELQNILEEKLLELRQQVQQTEHLTREILRTEFATTSTEEKHSTLQTELQSLLESNKKEELALQRQPQQIDSLRQTRHNLEERKEQLLQEIENQRLHNQSYTEDLRDLEQQNKEFEEENAKLKLQIDFLRENIAKLRQLKEENMLSVMNLTNSLQEVSSGKD